MQASFDNRQQTEDQQKSAYGQEAPDSEPEIHRSASHVHKARHSPIELRHLRYFVAVAEHGHFGRAARALNVSQPPLSRQIRDLERHLGVNLLDRHPNGVSLTEHGQRLLIRSRHVLAEFSRAIDHVSRAGA